MESAYAAAIEAEFTKRRGLPDWSSTPAPVRPRPNPVPAVGGASSPYAAAIEAESAKRRRLPDWSSTPAPVRPRPNPVPAAGGASSPSWVLSMESAYAAAIEAESAKRRRLPDCSSTPAPVRPRPNPVPAVGGASSPYAAAIEAESAKRRRLPDWSSTPAPVRPRPNPVPAAGGASSPSWVLSMESVYAAAMEADYAAESAKRRRLPDWSSTPSPVRPRPNPAPAAGGASSPSCVLSPPTCQANVQARHEQVAFNGKIVYCRTPSEVEKATREIVLKIESMKASGQVSLGFDLEWKPFPRRGEPPCKVALMQLCMDKTHCYVMHIIHSGVPPILKSLLEDSSTVKVGVCIDNDARKMFNGYNVRVQPLMDLSTVANFKLAGPRKRWSLAALTEMITCKELPKPGNIRMGNWEAYVLSKKQLQYAATDAYISWYLYEVLRSLPDPDIETEVV